MRTQLREMFGVEQARVAADAFTNPPQSLQTIGTIALEVVAYGIR